VPVPHYYGAVTNNLEQPSVKQEVRRPFASKFAHRGWGIGLAVVGGLVFLGGFAALGPGSTPIPSFVIGLVLIAWAVYLLRGQGINPAVAERRAAEAQRKAAIVAASIDQAKAALAAAGAGGAALVAYRNLDQTVKQSDPQNAQARLAEILTEIAFDPSSISQSPRYGTVGAVGGGIVEIFRDWIVFGQEAHDVDLTTRAQVFVDGSIQVTSSVVTNKKGKSRVVNQQHDMRTAQLQLTSATWSMSVRILPDQANEARRAIDQLAAHVESLKPQNATAADIRSMVDTILNATGQPPAEKLKQLSNLRYERLLTDEEFESAKTRILGI
jgi:hypothetical protein